MREILAAIKAWRLEVHLEDLQVEETVKRSERLEKMQSYYLHFLFLHEYELRMITLKQETSNRDQLTGLHKDARNLLLFQRRETVSRCLIKKTERTELDTLTKGFANVTQRFFREREEEKALEAFQDIIQQEAYEFGALQTDASRCHARVKAEEWDDVHSSSMIEYPEQPAPIECKL